MTRLIAHKMTASKLALRFIRFVFVITVVGTIVGIDGAGPWALVYGQSGSAMSRTASTPSFRVIAPDLVAQGEEFTGVVVQETDKGEVPLQGAEVIFQGSVIPVEPGGKVRLSGLLGDVGHHLLELEVVRNVGGVRNSAATVSQYIDVLPVPPNVSTVIARAPEICAPGQPLRVTGQALNNLTNPALVGQGGALHPLGASFGSSLQRIYFGPADLPKGSYRFVAQDASGHTYQAPNDSKNPTLQLTGTQVRQRGQRGQLTVTSDAEGEVLLSGGEPQIVLDQKVISVGAQAPAKVQFTAVQLGNYAVEARLLDPDERIPGASTPRVDIETGPVESHYDRQRNETSMTCPVRVIDEEGHGVANTLVDVAITHPGGVQYQHIKTDAGGHADCVQRFPGQLPANSLTVHPYHVLGHEWNKLKSAAQGGGDGAAGILGKKEGKSPSPSTCGPPPPSTTYTVKNLATAGKVASAHCFASAINDAGEVVGSCEPSYFGVTGKVWNAFLTGPGDVIKSKDDLSLKAASGFPGKIAGGESVATAINSGGHVAGWLTLAGSGDSKAFFYDGEKMNNLHGAASSFKNSAAHALNTSDDVVGEAWTITDDKHAVIWLHGDHTMVDLNTFLPAVAKKDWTLNQAYAISDEAHIVGRATHLGKVHAFLLKAVGEVPIDLGAITDFEDDSSAAYSLNACDDVVGYTHLGVSKEEYHGFEWTESSGMTDMGILSEPALPPSFLYGYAQAINKKGEVVGAVSVEDHKSVIFLDAKCKGTCFTVGGSGGLYSHAVWYGGSKKKDLKELKDLNDLIPDSPGWELEFANGINDKGQIVGSGFYKKGPYAKAVLLTPKGLATTGSTASSTSSYLFDNWNIYTVKNKPVKDTVFILDSDAVVTFIADYHWNYGSGALPSSKGISLKDSSGAVFGPWPVTTSSGQGGALNVAWEAHLPGVLLPAGTYTVIDPDPATWSQNDTSGGSGFTRVAGSKKK